VPFVKYARFAACRYICQASTTAYEIPRKKLNCLVSAQQLIESVQGAVEVASMKQHLISEFVSSCIPLNGRQVKLEALHAM
jgi:hypothetical protein